MDKTETLDRLGDVLDAEEDALLVGDYDAVETMLPDKENLIGQLNDDPPEDEAALRWLRDKIARNQTLLDNAMNGVRTVATRMKELQRARDRFETYDQSGQRQSIDTRVYTKLEKRV